MAKGNAVRQRVKKQNSSTNHSKGRFNSASTEKFECEHQQTQDLRKYLISVLVFLFCGVSWIFYSRVIVPARVDRTNNTSTSEEDVELPCRYDGEFTVDRRSNLSLEEFVRCYDAKRPVIITDVVENWKAMHWSKTFLVNNYGEKRVSMKATEGPLRTAKGFAVPLKVFAQHVHEGKPQLWTYLEDELFIEMNPELRENIGQPVYLREDFFQLLPKEIRPWNAMLLWGTAHSRSSLHIDPYNWTGTNAVLSGSKMWKIFPPGQDDLLYVIRNQRCGFPLDCLKYNSPIDAFDPDYEQYPLFRRARAISFTQKAGELFLIPTGWFHQAYNPVETMAISSQVMNSQNYKLVIEEICKAGEVHANKLPSDFDSLSPREQVQAVIKIIPKSVIEKGMRVTQDILKQLKWQGKGRPGT